ncbi:ATP-binding protein [Leptospira gomenensis]|uniref:ATP-binding protein n=1 Tax=Leptospira gomenensis TaxID=2484974 RepID=A0A5F1YFG6_9LEPT|nr:ATP-binding protein [Leptospira gomenensis]TGK38417.1 ATP-binding protein [Leptospira gomenensis]TGK42001.1 ATP-binding protein [Leptospira gomenensis]TGK52231.1 ATP-binding protein [Leptospira gomenensis]TGK55782.1 ATP-binding protein [Leptospira gomenensis]
MSPEEKRIQELEDENRKLKRQIENTAQSPYLKKGMANVRYYARIFREEIVENEIRGRIDESLGTLYEIKNFVHRYSSLAGLDPDTIRIIATEATQNIVEHGQGKYAEIELELHNEVVNPFFKMSFKHEMKPGMKYTLSQINENVKRGDFSSELFDIESSRGRGEFLMKELADERRVLNGVEITPEGDKVHYFKRVLINYRDPKGPRDVTSFDEIKEEIDRLDPEEALCYFHIDHRKSKLSSVTIVVTAARETKLRNLMEESGFYLVHKDKYYRAVFCSFEPTKEFTPAELESLFEKVRKQVEIEKE